MDKLERTINYWIDFMLEGKPYMQVSDIDDDYIDDLIERINDVFADVVEKAWMYDELCS